MPSKSPEQAKTMRALAHGWKPPRSSKVAKIPVNVAKDFAAADQKTGKYVGQNDGSSAAMARGGSALSKASVVTAKAEKGCNG